MLCLYTTIQTWVKSAESRTRPPSPKGRTRQAWLTNSSMQRLATGTELKQNSHFPCNNLVMVCLSAVCSVLMDGRVGRSKDYLTNEIS